MSMATNIAGASDVALYAWGSVGLCTLLVRRPSGTMETEKPPDHRIAPWM